MKQMTRSNVIILLAFCMLMLLPYSRTIAASSKNVESAIKKASSKSHKAEKYEKKIVSLEEKLDETTFQIEQLKKILEENVTNRDATQN